MTTVFPFIDLSLNLTLPEAWNGPPLRRRAKSFFFYCLLDGFIRGSSRSPLGVFKPD